MSDIPQGPGWWQAPDGKWYRPESSRAASTHPRPKSLAIVVGATLLLVLIIIVVVATSGRTRRVPATLPSAVSTSATTTATTTTTTPLIIYRVKQGDSLTKIANYFRVSVSAIISRNQIANPDRLSEGQPW